MRKNIIFALLLTLIAASSCVKDPEQHRLVISYPDGYPLYADQTEDSIIFGTFDSWKVHSLEPWITVKGESSKNVTYNYYKFYVFGVDLDIKPNTTGHTRYGSVEVDSYEYQAYGFYIQYGFLNIYHPQPNVLNIVEDYRLPDSVEFVLRDSADVLTDSICFKVRNDWTLTPVTDGKEAQWVTASQTSGKAGEQTVQLTMEPNTTTGRDRMFEFILQSGEVKNVIRVEQSANKKDTPKEEE